LPARRSDNYVGILAAPRGKGAGKHHPVAMCKCGKYNEHYEQNGELEWVAARERVLINK